MVITKLRPFHIALHALPSAVTLGPEACHDGINLRLVLVAAHDLQEPLETSFEDAIARLNTLSRMFTEPDGSFTWGSDPREPSSWRLDGCLFDRDGRLMYVELKGACSFAAWRNLIVQLCPSSQPLLIQWIERGVFTNELEFRNWLGGAS